jgi:hypothetical protein
MIIKSEVVGRLLAKYYHQNQKSWTLGENRPTVSYLSAGITLFGLVGLYTSKKTHK